ncbi:MULTISPECIES: hypothetical protein [unclassified Streptomyces]|uniref:hypothetical protein n=1 Tax=unclassified Streptomyces TaxID=2593676 RepID=UPI0035DF4D9C
MTGAAAAGVLAGCSDAGGGQGAAAGAREAAKRAEAALRERTSAASRALVTQYDAVLAMHPSLRDRLAPLRDQAAQHDRALTPPPAATPSPAVTPPAAVSSVPADAEDAVKQLADAERRTSDAQLAAVAAAPPELARLLASVAASGAGHAYLLGGGA